MISASGRSAQSTDRTQNRQGMRSLAEAVPSATATKACEKAEAITPSFASVPEAHIPYTRRLYPSHAWVVPWHHRLPLPSIIAQTGTLQCVPEHASMCSRCGHGNDSAPEGIRMGSPRYVSVHNLPGQIRLCSPEAAAALVRSGDKI